MPSAIIIVLDSVGVGFSDDAALYNDEGANTLGHIADHCALNISNLTKLGIVNTLYAASGSYHGLKPCDKPNLIGAYGYAKEQGPAKDTVGGHWEIAGAPLTKDWKYFDQLSNSFPLELINSILKKANLKGFLGNCHASGTEIINKLGQEHINTGHPIFYTSADSVFQIAAHEVAFGLESLYKLCLIAEQELIPYNICRVIARPFVGSREEGFTRTSNRKDYTAPPTEETLLDIAKKENKYVIGVGKIGDIFAQRGLNLSLHTNNNQEGVDQTIKAIANKEYKDKLIFTNLVDFDSLFGHRRDIKGYAKAIEEFDARIPEILKALTKDDLLIITADHGNDPSFRGNDHTREHIPILCYQHNIKPSFLGKRFSYADIATTVAEHLQLNPLKNGKSFYNAIKIT